MSIVYLIRHGQGGPRNRYDELSELGREQARRLGEYLVAEQLPFATVISGALKRQMQTAELVAEAFARNGAGFPARKTDARWNEFDLSRVYREIGPALAREEDHDPAGLA